MCFTDVLLESVDCQLSNMWLDREFSTSIYQIILGRGKGDFQAMNISLVCLSLISSSSFCLAKTNSFIKMLHLTCCCTKLIYECLFILDFDELVTNNWIICEWVYFSYFEYTNGHDFHTEGIYEWGYFSKSRGAPLYPILP
jgi:hypothetical protein